MTKTTGDNSGLGDLAVDTQLKISSRMGALEYFACQWLMAILPPARQDPEYVDRMHRRILEQLSMKNAELLSETNSDIAMSELQYAVRRLISLQRSMLGLSRRLPARNGG